MLPVGANRKTGGKAQLAFIADQPTGAIVIEAASEVGGAALANR